jgi:hypothetical protein
MKPGLIRWITLTGGLAAVASTALPAAATATPTATSSARPATSASGEAAGWRLLDAEDFSRPLPIDSAAWKRDPLGTKSPWHVDGYDDDGPWYRINGGSDFVRDVHGFDLMRKRVSFGKGDWLTAELGDMDFTKTGKVSGGPTIQTVRLPNGGGYGARINEPTNGSGAIIRSTRPLPAEYRIEYTLKTVDFGGQRNGSYSYDGKVNGYPTTGCTTNFPWKSSGSFAGPANPCNPNFSDSKSANGFYFLEVTDYPAAPHNNVQIHHHRKVGMDAYNTTGATSTRICNPATKQLYGYNDPASSGNAINAVFNDGSRFQNPSILFPGYLDETPCGSFTDKDGLIESGDMQPELMPNQSYKFAVERTQTGYTMEVTGNFRGAGYMTIREHRDFVQSGVPIWHYNNTPGQYNGAFNRSQTDTGPYGTYTAKNVWPKGSAYPDYFVIGDPHLNYYSGSATIGAIRLYVPKHN